MMKLLARTVLPLAAGALVLAGCTSTQAGTASPVGGPATGPSAVPSSTEAGGADTASIEPCSLIKAEDLTAYGTFEGPHEKKLGGARGCSYYRTVTSASEESATVGVAIRDDAPLASVNDTGGGLTDREINGRKAKEAPGGPSQVTGCALALGVGDKSRVDVNVTSVETVEKACQIAEDVATKSIEPRLPKG